MTVVFIDPIHGAALTAGLLPILPALPCPTCGGSGGSLGPNEWQGWRPCPDCNGSGVWTPPDSPVPIGVTSALPEEWAKFGDFTIRLYDDGMWRLDNLMGDDLSRVHPIVLSSVIGEGMLRKLKVVEREWIEGGFIGTSEDVVATMPVDHPAYPALHLWLNGEFARDISSALPFLPGLKPEDTVYLLDGFTESVECPEWHDSTPEDVINEVERRLRDEEWSSRASDRCRTALLHIDAYREGKARSQSVGRLSCPFPVDAPDHPCVLEAT